MKKSTVLLDSSALTHTHSYLSATTNIRTQQRRSRSFLHLDSNDKSNLACLSQAKLAALRQESAYGLARYPSMLQSTVFYVKDSPSQSPLFSRTALETLVARPTRTSRIAVEQSGGIPP